MIVHLTEEMESPMYHLRVTMEKHQAVQSLLWVCLALLCPNAAEATSKLNPGSIANREVRFLLAVRSGTTYRQVKAALPSGTYIAVSRWGTFFDTWCNYIEFRGAIRGFATFQTPAQRKFAGGTVKPTDPSETKLREGDPVSEVWIVMDNGVLSRRADLQRIRAIQRIVGKPSSLSNETEDGSWTASWKLGGGRSLDYSAQAEMLNLDKAVPTLRIW